VTSRIWTSGYTTIETCRVADDMPSGCREWAITAEGAISPLAGLGSNTSMPCTVLAVARPRRASSLVGVRGEAVVSVFRQPVVLLPSLPVRIDVNHHPAEVRQVVQKLVADLLRDLVTVCHR
jgi:hypothetical protein